MAWLKVYVQQTDRVRDRQGFLSRPRLAVWQHNPYHAQAVADLRAGIRSTPTLPWTFVARREYDWWQLGTLYETIIDALYADRSR